MTDKRFDVTALGEILIDFTEWGFSGCRHTAVCPKPRRRGGQRGRGGGPAGWPCGLCGQGGRGYARRVPAPNTARGRRGRVRLATDAERFTTLALRQAGGKRRAVVFLLPATTRRTPACAGSEVPQPLLTDTRVLAVGTLGMTDEPMRTTQLLHRVRRGRRRIYRLRPQLPRLPWRGEGDFLRQTERLLALADYVKLSDEETALVTGKAHPQDALEVLAGRGVKRRW